MTFFPTKLADKEEVLVKLQSSTFSMRRAFTLIELMVVVGIIVIILAVALPAVKSITKGNDAVQAQNMLSALITNARSVAISQGRYAALILYEENAGTSPQTSAVFAVEDRGTTTDTAIRLLPLGSGTVQRLPLGAKVAGLDPQGVLATAQPPRIILFDNLGQMVLRGNIGLSSSSDPNTTSILAKWTTDFGASPWTSTPGLVVYSDNEYRTASPSNPTQWLMAHAKVLVVNGYTGTVIR